MLNTNGVDRACRGDSAYSFFFAGLIRSAGSWSAVRELKRSRMHMKSDEHIMGDGDFVSAIMSRSRESLERRYVLKASGIDIDFVSKRVSALLSYSGGRHRA